MTRDDRGAFRSLPGRVMVSLMAHRDWNKYPKVVKAYGKRLYFTFSSVLYRARHIIRLRYAKMLLRYDALSIARNVLPFTINRYRDTSAITKFLYAIYCRYTYRPGGNRGNASLRLLKINPKCYLSGITIRSEFVFTRYRSALVVFPPYKPWFVPRSSTAKRKSVAISPWWNSFNKVPSLSPTLPRARARWKHLTSEQSKSNLDSDAIKASATSHFTIRRVHMVRTLHTRARTGVHVTWSQPSVVRCIKYVSGNIWPCELYSKILNRVLRWRVRRRYVKSPASKICISLVPGSCHSQNSSSMYATTKPLSCASKIYGNLHISHFSADKQNSGTLYI